jgi:hypothetical protein
MGKKGGSKAIEKQAQQDRADEQGRQQSIRDGTTRVNSIFDGQFTPDYYESQKKAYTDYATPQLDDQYSAAQKQLTFSLARGGNIDSSAASGQTADLQKQYDLNKQKIADDALSYGAKAKTSVEDARSNLVSLLNSTGDAEGAANSAVSRAAALSQPAAYSPLTSLFADFTNALGTVAAQNRANTYGGGAGVGTSATTFDTNKNAVKVS